MQLGFFVLYTVTPVSLVLAIKASFIAFACCNTFSCLFFVRPVLSQNKCTVHTVLEDRDIKIIFA